MKIVFAVTSHSMGRFRSDFFLCSSTTIPRSLRGQRGAVGTSQKSRIFMPSRLFGRSPYPLVGYDGNHGTSQRRSETEQRAHTRSRAHFKRRKRAVRRSRGGHASFGDALLACWRQVKNTAGHAISHRETNTAHARARACTDLQSLASCCSVRLLLPWSR